MSFIELVAQRHPPKPPAGMQPPENAADWFRMEATPGDDDSTDIYIYESIGGWFGMWAEDFIRDLKQVTTGKINLRLNSPGGSVFDGIAIANAIRSHTANVTVYVDSLAASIASVIALAGNRVVMMPQSQFMVHNASGSCYGDATEMTKMADLLDKQSRNIAEAYAQHTGRPLAEWQQYMADETWFTAEEAVAVGLADEVMPMKQAEPAEDETVDAAMRRTWDLSMYQHAGRAQAPAPAITPRVTVRAGEYVLNQATPAQVPKTPGEVVVRVKLDPDVTDLGTLITELVRKEVRARLDVTDEQAPPDDSPAEPTDASTPPPDEDEEEEDDDDGPPWENAADEQPPDGSLTTPEVADEQPPEETPPDSAPPAPEAHDEADDWNQLVGFLVSPATSPSADDVFAQLKEGW